MAEEKTADEIKREATAKKLAFCAGLMMASVTMVVPTRAPMVLKVKKGDAAATAKAMGLMSTCAAIIELGVNPIIGKLSDQLGRKPFLIFAPMVNAFLHTLVAMFPSSLSMQFIDRMISGSMIFGFLAPQQAAMADLYAKTPAKLALFGATSGMYFGLGTTVGPFIGSKLGGAKSFLASALAFLATALYVGTQVDETLMEESKRQFKWSSLNPFAFLALFKERTLGWLAGVAALGSFGDYVNIYDINNLFMIKCLGYGAPQMGNFAMTVGLSQIAGGKVTGEIVKKVGLKAHVFIANLMWAVGMITMGTARSTPHAFVALLLWTFGHQRANSVSVNMQTYGAAQGMGRGEIIAASSNLLAWVKIMIPLLYSNIFAWATSNGRNMPGLPYFIIAALTAAAQGVYLVANPKE